MRKKYIIPINNITMFLRAQKSFFVTSLRCFCIFSEDFICMIDIKICWKN
jgi:hypothetical protein